MAAVTIAAIATTGVFAPSGAVGGMGMAGGTALKSSFVPNLIKVHLQIL